MEALVRPIRTQSHTVIGGCQSVTGPLIASRSCVCVSVVSVPGQPSATVAIAATIAAPASARCWVTLVSAVLMVPLCWKRAGVRAHKSASVDYDGSRHLRHAAVRVQQQGTLPANGFRSTARRVVSRRWFGCLALFATIAKRPRPNRGRGSDGRSRRAERAWTRTAACLHQRSTMNVFALTVHDEQAASTRRRVFRPFLFLRETRTGARWDPLLLSGRSRRRQREESGRAWAEARSSPKRCMPPIVGLFRAARNTA